MKQRFVTDKSGSPFRTTIISIVLFICVFCIFYFGVTYMSQKTATQEKQTLEAAINRGVVHCYAIEGTYPENLQYLVNNYGLIYDADKYFIDYQTLGSNIMPDITIIDRGNSK